MKRISESPYVRRGTFFSSGLSKSQFLLAALCWLMAIALFPIGCDRSAPGPINFVDCVSSVTADCRPVRLGSIRKDARLSAPITFGGETRRSLTPPLQSELSFPAVIPEDAVLRFAIGIKTFRDTGRFPKIVFRLTLGSNGDQQTLFEERLGVGRVDRWIEREVDLGPYSGSSVELGFETKMQTDSPTLPAVAGDILPLWGNPVLSGSGGETVLPNLILISLDCVRPDHMGAYGYSRETTPNIDRFAEEGVVFETAVGTAASTLPSHLSMLTGLPPSLHGTSNWEGLSKTIPYLPELLSQIGYQSDGVVSTAWLSESFGVERGFHVFRTFDDPRAERIVSSALELVEWAKGRPQFLFVHLYDAHWPYRPPRELVDRFAERPPDMSGLLEKVGRKEIPASQEEIEQVINLYDAEIAYTDSQVGRFLDALEKMGLYENSLIAIVSDHGEAFYEHEHWAHSVSLYDEVIRVPLIVKWPGGSPRARVASQVSLVDIFATLLEQAEHPERAEVSPESQDLLRFLTGSRDEPETSLAISEILWKPKSTSAPMLKISFRDTRLKYIATLGGSEGDMDALAVHEMREEEFYDLENDPGERQNLAGRAEYNTEPYRRLLREYLEKARNLRALRDDSPLVLDEELKEKLRSLGYVIH